MGDTGKKRRKTPTLGMTIVKRHAREDEYLSQFLGGRYCARITIPIISEDQIRKAAIVLREAAEDLTALCDEGGSKLGKVIGARSIVGAASKRLKGGVHYKGAR